MDSRRYRLKAQLSVRAIRPLISAFRALGHDPAPILSAVQLDEAMLGDPDAHIPMTAGVSLLLVAAEKTADPNIGLHLAQHADLASFDILFHIIALSPTLGVGYDRISRYQKLINDSATVELITTGDRAMLRHRLAGGLAVPRQSAEFIVVAWMRAGRIATNVDWAPAEVRFAHAAPANVQDHADFFRAPVLFSTGENALVFPANLLDMPCSRSDPDLLRILERYASDLLARIPGGTSVADRVRSALAVEMRDGEPKAPNIAARLKVSVRTLNRMLTSEGTNYRELLEHLRKELAARYLGDDNISISETAFLLGFSELSAFYRAFHRWTGQTPAEFRRSIRSRSSKMA